MRKHQKISRSLAVAMGFTLVVAVGGCSTDKQAEATSTSSSSSLASASSNASKSTDVSASQGSADAGGACATKAAAKVDAATSAASFVPPTEPVSMSAAAGKKVWFIAPDMSLPFIASIAKGFTEGATAAGMSPTVFDGKGNVTTFNQGVSTAVAQQADAILLQGINPALVSDPLSQAISANTVIVDSLNGGPDAPTADGVQAHVTVDYAAGGALMAADALARSNCQGTLVFFTSSIYAVYVDMLAGFNQEVKSLCPDCDAPVVVDVAPTDLATKLPTLVSTNLTLNPTSTVFVAAYDGMVQFMSPSIQEAGSKVVIVSHDGADASLAQIKSANTPLVSTISNPPNEAIGWAEVDQLGRLLTGGTAIVPDLPQQIFNKDNTAADAASMFPGFADYQMQYQKLWGLSS